MTSLESTSAQSVESSELDLQKSRAARKQAQAISDWTRQQFKQIKNARTVIERQWYLNLAFYFGKQHVQVLRPEINSGLTTTRLYVPPAPPWRMRPVINRIRPTLRTELAQLTGNRPNASIVPASAEDRDMYAAMAGEQIWENLYTDRKLKFIIRRAVWWALVCGNGFIKSFWDPSIGPVEEQPGFDPQTGQLVMMPGQPQGDISYSPETPFHILVPDFREEELENQPYLLHCQTRSPEWARMKFGDKIDYTNTASGDAHSVLEETFLNLIGTQTMQKQQSVLVLEVWIKPGQHPMFPKGAFYTMVGDQIVQAFEGWPYKHGKYPFAKLDHIPGGKFYSSSLVEDLIPLQKEYNRTRGQIIEAKNRTAKPQLIAPRGSIDPKKITTEPGQVILYTPGVDPPQPLPLQPLPNYVLEENDRILQDWSDIAGQHEVTHGEVPPGVTAATAISYLQERDESKLAPTFDSLEEGIEKIAQMSLSYVQDFWSESRTVRVTGPDGSFDTIAFKGSDLRNNIDIRVEGGSALPTSKAAKQALLMDLGKMGFIDPQKMLSLMDMGGMNKLYEQIQIDERQAQRENLRMSKVTEEQFLQYKQQNDELLMQNEQHFGMDEESGMPLDPPILIPVNTWDNHQKHIEIHNNFRKGQAFEQLDEANKVLFERHVMEHINAISVEQVTMNTGGPSEEGEEDVESGESSKTGPTAEPNTETV